MTEELKELILEHGCGHITQAELLDRLPPEWKDVTTVRNVLECAANKHDREDLEWGLSVAFGLGIPEDWGPFLCRMLLEPWHRKHEDFASALQDLRLPDSVDALHTAALTDHDYLSYDDALALAVKCCWALGDIGTPGAIEALRAIARCENPVKRHAAEFQLARAASDR